jgi:hypothetical protein
MASPASNPKMRITGLVLVVIGLLGLIGTVTGWDTHGTTGRVVFAVVGAVLVLLGVALLRTRTSAVSTLAADPHGITVGLRGRGPFTVPWTDVDSVWLRRLDPIFGGHLLFLQLVTPPPHATSAALREFTHVEPDGATLAMIGLNSGQAKVMLAQLPAAGQRYRGVSGRTAPGR